LLLAFVAGTQSFVAPLRLVRASRTGRELSRRSTGRDLSARTAPRMVDSPGNPLGVGLGVGDSGNPFLIPVVGPALHELGQVGDVINFFLPFTLAVGVSFALDAGKKKATASHILIDDAKKIIEVKNSIESGELAFDDAARQFSTCPSSKKGGDLGQFKQGSMVPEFDRAVFEALDSDLGSVLGPIRTQFGWHLIKVQARS